MKRYCLFLSFDISPQGGWNDFYKSSDNLDELVGLIDDTDECWTVDTEDGPACIDWWHIVDYTTGKIIKEGS